MFRTIYFLLRSHCITVLFTPNNSSRTVFYAKQLLCGSAKCKYWDGAFVLSLKAGCRVDAQVPTLKLQIKLNRWIDLVFPRLFETERQPFATIKQRFQSRKFMHKNMIFKFANRKLGDSPRNIFAVWLVVQPIFVMLSNVSRTRPSFVSSVNRSYSRS